MKLGDLSAEFESNGDPSTISSGIGDYGGQSFGSYQFIKSTTEDFVNWLVNQGHQFGQMLSAYEVCSDSFNYQWQYIGSAYTNEFSDLQHEYTKEMYYDIAVANLNEVGYNVLSKSDALQQVVWSRSVQYSPRWIVELFQLACDLAGQSLDTIDEKNLIYYVYEVCLTNNEWCQGSEDVKYGLRNRFENEREKALELLG